MPEISPTQTPPIEAEVIKERQGGGRRSGGGADPRRWGTAFESLGVLSRRWGAALESLRVLFQ